MASYTPVDTQSLLPPFLACLPTAFASPKPPPAVLPLLSPILSQRIQLLSESGDRPSWLPLLNWDDQEAAQLAKVVEKAELEPHPISGEIEIDDPEPTKYRRVDEETLQALVSLPEVGLAIVYVWSTAEGKEAWRVAEVKPTPGNWSRSPAPWESSMAAAQDAFESKTHASSNTTAQTQTTKEQQQQQSGGQEEDDGDYWARYDNTPGPTPSRTPAKHSPAPPALAGGASKPAAPDDSYWGQYGAVQPAMDNDDPDERAANAEHMGDSGLNGDAILAMLAKERGTRPASTSRNANVNAPVPVPAAEAGQQRSLYTPNGSAANPLGGSYTVFPPTAPETRHSPTDASYEHIQHPRPRSAQSSAASASSRSSRVVEQLEDQAERNSTVADVAIQQHISTSMKSLYRLAKGAGMERKEFERIIHSELDVLSMMDDD